MQTPETLIAFEITGGQDGSCKLEGVTAAALTHEPEEYWLSEVAEKSRHTDPS